MRIVLLQFLFFTLLLVHAQNPADKVDFGKGNTPSKNKEWVTISDPQQKLLDTILLPSGSKIHPSKTFLGDTTSVSFNGLYIEHDSKRLAPVGSNATSYYSEVVTNKDWNFFRAYVRDSVARRVLGAEMGAEGWLIPVKNEKGYEKDESEWLLAWDRPKINWSFEPKNELFPFIAHLFYSEYESYYWQKTVDERKLTYCYYWLNLAELNWKRAPKIVKLDTNNAQPPQIGYRNAKGVNDPIRDSPKYIIGEQTALFRDSTLWITDTSWNHFSNVEDGLVQSYNYHPYFENDPVTCINAPQARAYLAWMQEQHQKRLDAEGSSYWVTYQLPTFLITEGNPNTEILTESFDLSPWQITNREYKEFVEYVTDSISRLILSYEFPKYYSIPTYDSELMRRDESEWFLNWKAKIDWKNKTGAYSFKDTQGNKVIPPYGLLEEMYNPPYYSEGNLLTDTNLIDKRKLIFKSYFYDFKTASLDVERYEDDRWREGAGSCEEKTKLYYESNGRCFRGNDYYGGKDLDLSSINSLCESSDVFSHEDRSTFIIRDQVNVYPGINHREANKLCDKNCQNGYEWNMDDFCKEHDCNVCPQMNYDNWESTSPEEYDFDSEPNALVQNITYFQFQAYWRWRIRKQNFPTKNENPVIQNYIPSEEEFMKIQKGESIEHSAEKHALPTPTFRYVVSFSSKMSGTNN